MYKNAQVFLCQKINVLYLHFSANNFHNVEHLNKISPNIILYTGKIIHILKSLLLLNMHNI